MSRSKRKAAVRREKRRLRKDEAQVQVESDELGRRAPQFVLDDIEVRRIDKDSRTAEFVAATQNGVVTWRGKEYLKLKGMSLSRYRRNPVVQPVHDLWEWPVGRSTDIRIEGKLLLVTIQFAETEEAENVWQLVQGGFLRALSVGFRFDRDSMVELDDGAEYDLDGEAVKGPAVIIQKSELYEISVVPVPADPATLRRGLVDYMSRFREQQAPQLDQEDRTMDELFELWCGARGIDPEKLNEKDREKREAECRKDLKKRLFADEGGETPDEDAGANTIARTLTFAEQLRGIAPRSIPEAEVDKVALEFSTADGKGNFEAAKERLLRIAAERSAPAGTPEPEPVPEKRGMEGDQAKRGKQGNEDEVDDELLVRSAQL